MFILSIFAFMENVIDTIRRMSKEMNGTGVIPMIDFYNERRRLENEELTSLRVNGNIAARKLMNGYGIELINK